MTVTVYIPRDAAALALGADEIAEAVAREAKARGAEVAIVRNGSRGMVWLEPLVEVETAGGRVAYGPVAAGDVVGLFDSMRCDPDGLVISTMVVLKTACATQQRLRNENLEITNATSTSMNYGK